jgi:hypothetical protein
VFHYATLAISLMQRLQFRIISNNIEQIATKLKYKVIKHKLNLVAFGLKLLDIYIKESIKFETTLNNVCKRNFIVPFMNVFGMELQSFGFKNCFEVTFI